MFEVDGSVDKDNPSECILAAAMERFCHYGFGKTTMAEIAEDCNMSAANLYRHYKNKADIGATIAKRWFDHSKQATEDIAEDSSTTPEQRLRDIFLVKHRMAVDMINGNPKISQLVDFIGEERPELVHNLLEHLYESIEKVLKVGVESGDFAPIENQRQVATSMKLAMSSLIAPPLLLRVMSEPCFHGDDLEKVLSSTLDLLMNGIKRRGHKNREVADGK